MPRPGDTITISATVLSVDEKSKIVVAKRIHVNPPAPKPGNPAATEAAGASDDYAVMWGS